MTTHHFYEGLVGIYKVSRGKQTRVYELKAVEQIKNINGKMSYKTHWDRSYKVMKDTVEFAGECEINNYHIYTRVLDKRTYPVWRTSIR